jgi:serine/threonine protein kinase
MKEFTKKSAVSLQQVQHIRDHIPVMTRFNHPLLPKLHYIFQDDRKIYVIMDYYENGELFEHIRKDGLFTADKAKFVMAEIISQIQHLHENDIVCRAIKPEDIVLDMQGHNHLVDFNFCKIIPNDRTLTLCGTPEYLAPEIIRRAGHGKSSDWWSVGVLLYGIQLSRNELIFRITSWLSSFFRFKSGSFSNIHKHIDNRTSIC